MEMDVLINAPPRTPESVDRVRRSTPGAVNHRIDQSTMKRIWHYATQSKDVISQRIAELEQEWDLDQFIETKAASLSLAGLLLGVTIDRRFLWVPAIVLGCLLQHAVKGSCPPVNLLRRLGVRTRVEIEAEKYALKILRGDFDALKTVSEETHRAIEALRVSRL